MSVKSSLPSGAMDYQKLYDELDSSTRSQESRTQEPNWLMKIAGLTSSKIKDFEDFCYIYDLSFLINRNIEHNAAEQIKPDGGLRGEELKIVAPSSFIDADVNLSFYQNKCLPEILLKRIISMNSENPKVIESYTFTNSFITSMLTKRDVIALSIRYSTVQRDTSVVKAEDGSIDGKKSALHSFIESMSKVGEESES